MGTLQNRITPPFRKCIYVSQNRLLLRTHENIDSKNIYWQNIALIKYPYILISREIIIKVITMCYKENMSYEN